MDVRSLYNHYYKQVTKKKNYEIKDIEGECMLYQELVKNLDEKDRNTLSEALWEFVRLYEFLHKSSKTKSVILKPKSVPGTKDSKNLIYEMIDFPDPLRDMLILCLREHVFPQ